MRTPVVPSRLLSAAICVIAAICSHAVSAEAQETEQARSARLARAERWHNKVFQMYPTGPANPIAKGQQKLIGPMGCAGPNKYLTVRRGDKNDAWRFYPIDAAPREGTEGLFVIAHVATGCVLTITDDTKLHSSHGANMHVGLKEFSQVADKKLCTWQLRFSPGKATKAGGSKSQVDRIQAGAEVCHIVSSADPNKELVTFHYGVGHNIDWCVLVHTFPAEAGRFTRGIVLSRVHKLEEKNCAWNSLTRYDGVLPRPKLTSVGGLPSAKELRRKAKILGEVWLPYFRIADPKMPSVADQMRKSPYYKLTRDAYFEIDRHLDSQLYYDNLAGSAPEVVNIGSSQSSSQTLTDAVTQTIGVSVSATAKSGVAGIAEVEMTATASWEMGTSHEQQTQEGKGGTLDVKHSIPAGTSMGLFRMINRISMKRLDGTVVRSTHARGTRVKAEFQSKKMHVVGNWNSVQDGWVDQVLELKQQSTNPDGDGWRSFTVSFTQKSSAGKGSRKIGVAGKYKGSNVIATWIVDGSVTEGVKGYLFDNGKKVHWPSQKAEWFLVKRK